MPYLLIGFAPPPKRRAIRSGGVFRGDSSVYVQPETLGACWPRSAQRIRPARVAQSAIGNGSVNVSPGFGKRRLERGENAQ
jgi:hypothetical protein